MSREVIYKFINRHGQAQTFRLKSFERALYIAANHHEEGFIVDSIIDGPRVYNHNEIIRLCGKYNLFR